MSKTNIQPQGVYVIAPTPFFPDGRIDEASIDRMTEFYIDDRECRLLATIRFAETTRSDVRNTPFCSSGSGRSLPA